MPRLAYADGKIRFRNFTGQLGSSDVEGNLEVDPGEKRPVVTADVTSRQVFPSRSRKARGSSGLVGRVRSRGIHSDSRRLLNLGKPD